VPRRFPGLLPEINPKGTSVLSQRRIVSRILLRHSIYVSYEYFGIERPESAVPDYWEGKEFEEGEECDEPTTSILARKL
jgi:hypothetical protein